MKMKIDKEAMEALHPEAKKFVESINLELFIIHMLENADTESLKSIRVMVDDVIRARSERDDGQTT